MTSFGVSDVKLSDYISRELIYCYMLLKRGDFNLPEPGDYFRYHQVEHSRIVHLPDIALICFV